MGELTITWEQLGRAHPTSSQIENWNTEFVTENVVRNWEKKLCEIKERESYYFRILNTKRKFYIFKTITLSKLLFLALFSTNKMIKGIDVYK